MTSMPITAGTRRRWTLALLALVCVLAIAAGTASRSLGAGVPQAERLRAIERARLAALVDADTTVAGRRLAGDFALVNPAGETLSKQTLLAAVGSGDLDFRVLEPSSAIQVRLHGNVAALRYTARFDVVVGGMRLSHAGVVTVVYERRQGLWQAVWDQTTAIPNDPEALIDALRPA